MIDLIRNEDMRMKFTIAYKAEWGESVHADITFFSRTSKPWNQTMRFLMKRKSSLQN